MVKQNENMNKQKQKLQKQHRASKKRKMLLKNGSKHAWNRKSGNEPDDSEDYYQEDDAPGDDPTV